MAATQLDIKNVMLTRSKALGNSNRGLKEVCSDLTNQHGIKGRQLRQLQDGTFLSRNTLERVASLDDCDSGSPYRPNADTLERILRYFGAEINFNQVVIAGKYQNREKAL